MRFLVNHLYEYRKGIRQLFMMTLTPGEAQPVRQRLEREEISYHVHEVNASKVNVLFGRSAWVETARSIVTKPLSRLSPEEDFILGTLLGYDPEQQCQRFLAMSKAGRAVA
ncbi:MAG: DUF2023 family protein [Magnetospirillum sp.]|nr:DUF2023 family protein [Magnetospirillum sp.]